MKESEIPMIGSGQRGETVEAPELEGADQIETPAVTPYEAMRKSIRIWGWWMLASAGASVLLGNPGWGAVLLVMALMSFYFRDAPGMFLILATGMLWAAVSNLFLGGEAVWRFLGGVQIVWVLLAFRGYAKYRSVSANPGVGEGSREAGGPSARGRSAKMTWLSLLLGAVGLAGLCSFIPLAMIGYSPDPNGPPKAVSALIEVFLILGAFAVPAGIAAASAGYRPKAPAIIGIVLGGLCILILMFGLMVAVAGWA